MKFIAEFIVLVLEGSLFQFQLSYLDGHLVVLSKHLFNLVLPIQRNTVSIQYILINFQRGLLSHSSETKTGVTRISSKIFLFFI